ncbi:hypothetical protein Dimus_033574 [Dionaea muscipula]
MPTSVSIAKQCLTEAAASALDEAVSVARRRGHPQTTSIHAVLALLSVPSSPLREACLRARNAVFYPRAQFKALDFCLSLSLDRLPTSQAKVNEPPIANSLMAAIKRSQANQRRQSDSHSSSVSGSIKQQLLLQQQQQQQQHGQEQGGSGVKVEIQHLIFAILDDPIVSRVFNEAGFSSFDVKLAIIRPLQSFFRYPRIRRPSSLYMCSLEGNFDAAHPPFRFPFSGSWASCDWNENSKRMGEVLARNRGRNALLIGACSSYALRSFTEAVERSENVLPLEISGVKVSSVEKEVLKMVSEKWSEKLIDMKFEELDSMAAHCFRAGLVVSIGELNVYVGEDDTLVLNLIDCVVRKLTKLLEVHTGRVWLIGSATSYEVYLKFLSRFPSVEKDWDLQLLPITSSQPSTAGSCLKSSSMGSFVPFGGFFSYPSSFCGSLRSPYEQGTCCQLCEDKFEQEVVSGFPASVVDQCQIATLPSSLPIAEHGATNGSHVLKAKDDNLMLTGAMAVLQKTWGRPSKVGIPAALENLTLELLDRPSKTEQATRGLGSPYSLANSSLGDGLTSPQAGSRVTTDLGLVTCSQSQGIQQNKFDFKALYEDLMRRVGRQEEAVKIISQTMTRALRKNGSLRGPYPYTRGDAWLCFLGADMFVKKRIALALAEMLCGSRDNFIAMDFGLEDGHQCRGKTAVDYIAQELRKAPLSVVFLENFQRTAPPAQSSLLQAVLTGKLSDSYGREVSTSNAIFVLASSFSNIVELSSPSVETSNFPEERIMKANNGLIQLSLEGGNGGQNLPAKRKLNVIDEAVNDVVTGTVVVKRPCKSLNMRLDLNLPAENAGADDESTNVEDNSIYENSTSWLEAIMDQVDEAILFKPFDYDALAAQVLKSIGMSFSKVFGKECLLEIELGVMDQILVAACFSDSKSFVEDWVEQVVGRAFAEAKTRYHLSAHSVLKLATHPPLSSKKQTSDARLPAEIILI